MTQPARDGAPGHDVRDQVVTEGELTLEPGAAALLTVLLTLSGEQAAQIRTAAARGRPRPQQGPRADYGR